MYRKLHESKTFPFHLPHESMANDSIQQDTLKVDKIFMKLPTRQKRKKYDEKRPKISHFIMTLRGNPHPALFADTSVE